MRGMLYGRAATGAAGGAKGPPLGGPLLEPAKLAEASEGLRRAGAVVLEQALDPEPLRLLARRMAESLPDFVAVCGRLAAAARQRATQLCLGQRAAGRAGASARCRCHTGP